MARRHGWQLPTNKFQAAGISLFFLLFPAFYVFLAPFLGNHIFEWALIAMYTPVSIAVIILYIRCVLINPADPRIMSRPSNDPTSPDIESLAGDESSGTGVGNIESLPRQSPDNDYSGHPAGQDVTILKSLSTCQLGEIIRTIFAQGDCHKDDTIGKQVDVEEFIFCTLCNAEVLRSSKHCKYCDKCVDEFNHHCRWLNNCVGRKNYATFFSLMLAVLIWLVIESGVSVAVLVLCFVNKEGTKSNIVDKFGDGFSHAPFATIVAICTAVLLVASMALGELFIFHILLIKKGITTYEYVKRMRAITDGNDTNLISSQINSLTHGESIGNSPRGLWCTPPGVFMDHRLYCQWRRTYSDNIPPLAAC